MPRVLFACVAALAFASPALAENPEPLLKRVGALPGELVKAGRTDAEMADALYVITLARLPTEKEKEIVVRHLSRAKDRAEAGRDLAWALVNSKEFLKVHGLDGDPVAAQKVIAKFIAEWGKDEKKEKKGEKK
jgi:hypothetical protein